MKNGSHACRSGASSPRVCERATPYLMLEDNFAHESSVICSPAPCHLVILFLDCNRSACRVARLSFRLPPPAASCALFQRTYCIRVYFRFCSPFDEVAVVGGSASAHIEVPTEICMLLKVPRDYLCNYKANAQFMDVVRICLYAPAEAAQECRRRSENLGARVCVCHTCDH